jgi:hypothetical protein
MTDAITLFDNPLLDEVVLFCGNNKLVGPRMAAIHALLLDRVLPARARYRAAVEAASKAKAEMDKRHADAREQREVLIKQVRNLDRYLGGEQIQAEIKAAEEAPVKIAAQANLSLSDEEISIAEAALQTYLSVRA